MDMLRPPSPRRVTRKDGAIPMSRLLGLGLVAAVTSAFGCGGGGPDCHDTCAKAGATQCSGTEVQTCTPNANGCLALSAPFRCGAGSFCSAAANACLPCVNTCAAVGASQCSATQVQTCTADANGCLSLSTFPVVRPVGTSAAPAAQVNHVGTKTVGEIVQFTIPRGTGGFSIVSQAVNAQIADVDLTQGSETFAVPNSVVPFLVNDPTGATFYNDNVSSPADRSTALAVYDGLSPSTGAFTVPNTTAALNAFSTGVPAGTWSFTVGDFAFECTRATNCSGGSTTSTYDITVITHPLAGSTGTLDVGIYLVTSSFTAATAQASPAMQRMVSVLRTIYARAGLTIRNVSFYDVSADAKARYATGIAADETGPCGDLDQMFTLSLPGKNELNLFFVDDIVQSATGGGVGTIVGIDGTIPGPSSIGGTVHSGAVVNASNIGANRVGAICNGAPDFVNCGSDRTAYIAAHEGGHFMGLYHTTESFGDTFDPVADTGQCVCTLCAPATTRAKCIQNEPVLPPGQVPTQLLGTNCNKAPGTGCEGAEDLMFWIIDGASIGNLSPQQGQIMRANPLVQ